MRKFNAILGMVIMVLFLIHVIYGSFILLGFAQGGTAVMYAVTDTMFTAVCLHIIIGVKLTIDTVKALKKSGANYFKDNKLFWIRRISGFALMLFIIAHAVIFAGHTGNDGYRLNLFEMPQLLLSLGMVITLLLHIVTNIRPFAAALGARSGREILADIAIILSAVLLVSGAAFVIYYIGWSF